MAEKGGGKPVTATEFTIMTRSKWLGHDETSVFCNVMESGDILEVERPNGNHWGVGIRTEDAKSKGPESIYVVSLQPNNGKDKSRKVIKESLHQFWTSGTKIRINYNSDREQPYHDEAQIRKQIEHALKHSDRKWHNPKHFAYWCRHGEKVPDRRRQISGMKSTIHQASSCKVKSGSYTPYGTILYLEHFEVLCCYDIESECLHASRYLLEDDLPLSPEHCLV